MNPKNLPQPQLEALTRRVLKNIAAGAGKHKSARFHLDLSNVAKPDPDCLSYRHNVTGTDPSAKGPLSEGQAGDEIDALLAKAVSVGRPFYLLQYDLKKAGTKWNYELKVQSCEEYRQMCKERRALEDQLEPLLLDEAKAMSKDWKEVTLDYDLSDKELRVTVVATEVVDVPASPDVRKAMEAIKAFYAAHGFTLQSYSQGSLGGPKKKVREVTDYYV